MVGDKIGVVCAKTDDDDGEEEELEKSFSGAAPVFKMGGERKGIDEDDEKEMPAVDEETPLTRGEELDLELYGSSVQDEILQAMSSPLSKVGRGASLDSSGTLEPILVQTLSGNVCCCCSTNIEEVMFVVEDEGQRFADVVDQFVGFESSIVQFCKQVALVLANIISTECVIDVLVNDSVARDSIGSAGVIMKCLTKYPTASGLYIGTGSYLVARQLGLGVIRGFATFSFIFISGVLGIREFVIEK